MSKSQRSFRVIVAIFTFALITLIGLRSGVNAQNEGERNPADSKAQGQKDVREVQQRAARPLVGAEVGPLYAQPAGAVTNPNAITPDTMRANSLFFGNAETANEAIPLFVMTAITCNGTGGGVWSSPGTWSGGVVPTNVDAVTIQSGCTVTIDTATAAAASINVQGGGILQYDTTIIGTLTVGGSVTIDPSGTVQSAATGTVTTHVLSIAGNLVNNGTLDFSTNTNTAAAGIVFTGASSNTFSGSGTTDIRTLTVNKGTSILNVLEITLSNLTVQGVNTDVAGFLTLTNGTLKISGSFTMANRVFTAAAYSIPATGGIWLNNSTFTISGQNGSPTNSGLLRLTNGIYNVGTSSGNSMGTGTGCSFIIEGGTMNVAGRLNGASTFVTYTQTAGTVNVSTVGNAAATPSFGFTGGTGVLTNISGGNINLVQASTNAAPLDYNQTGTMLFTGGTLTAGTAATTANFIFRIQGQIPALVIDNTTNNKNVNLSGQANPWGNVTINPGTTLNLNGQAMLMIGQTITNNGAISVTTNNTGTMVYGGTQQTVGAPYVQSYTGTGTFGTAAIRVGTFQVQNQLGVNINSGVPVLNCYRINALFGAITNSNLIANGVGDATALIIQRGVTGNAFPAGSFDVAPTSNIGAGGLTLVYAQSTTLITTGPEIPATRSILGIQIINSTGVTLSGGALTATNAASGLLLSSGTLNTSAANLLTLSATATGSLSGGSAVTYVNGPLARTLPASLASGSTYTFPVGKGSFKMLELVNPTTTAGGTAVIQTEVFDTNSGGTAGAGLSSINSNRYWSSAITSGAGNFTNATVRLTEQGTAAISAIGQSATQTGAYASIGGTVAPPTIGPSSAVTSLGFFAVGTLTGAPTISGNFTVGAAGTYLTLTAAVADLNTKLQTGPVSFTLLDNVYASETYPITIQPNAGASAVNTLTIKPNTGATPSFTGSSASALIVLNGADFVTIDGANTVGGITRNMTLANTNIATTSAVIWCQTIGTSDPVTNNTIKNLNLAGNAATTTFAGVGTGSSTISTASVGTRNDNNRIQNNGIIATQIGVFTSGASATNKNFGTVITGNTIGGAAANAVGREGIFVGFEDGVQITNNNVAGVSGAVASVDAIGIAVGTVAISTTAFTISEVVNQTVSNNVVGSVVKTDTFSAAGIVSATSTYGTTRITNNMISGVVGDGTSGDFCVGLYIGNGGVANSPTQVYYNSVSMTAAGRDVATATSQPSFAFAILGANPLVDVRNNIFYNTQTAGSGGPGGVAGSFAIGLSSIAPFTNITSNNNDLFTSGASSHFAVIGGLTNLLSEQPTLAAWQVTTGKDANSVTGNPQFLSLTDLHINTGAGTPVESTGTPIAGITTDIDGDTRNATTPDIGADEGTFVALVTNDIQATAFVDPTNGGSKLASAPFAPQASFTNNGTAAQTGIQVRYRICADVGCTSVLYNNTQSIASLTSGATTTVTFASTSLGAGAYTIKAKAELAGDAVPANDEITGTLNVEAPLSGPYTVGSAGTYSTLTQAIGKLNSLGVTGPVTLLLQDSSYSSFAPDSTGEVFPLTINSIAGASSTNKITIKPAAGVTPSITGTSSSCIFNLNGADWITIDGSNGGGSPAGTSRDLTVTNTNAGTATAVVCMETTAGADAATNNVVKNTNLVGSSVTATAGTLAGVFSGSSTISNTSTGTGNNSNTIQNNNISKTVYGIYSGGASAAAKNTGTVITQNVMNAASPNNVTTGGILVNFDDGAQITQNNIGNILKHDGTVGTTGTVFGIALGVVPSNTVTTFTGNDVTNAVVTRNKIDALTQLNSTGFSSFGIVINSVTSGTTQVANNMISQVRSASTASDFSGGIIAGGGTGSTTQIYFNSVSMTGSRVAASFPSYGIAINTGNPIVDVRNNVFYNTQTTSSTGKMYAIANASTTIFTNMTSNHNDFFVSGATSFIGQTGGLGTAGTDRLSLSDWQTATGQDTTALPESLSTDPLFVSVSDLHLQPGSPLISAGVTGTGVTNDFDGDLRDATPDIGADEGIVSTDLAITKTDGVTTAVPGGSVTYTITASNAGPSPATGATVADTFPASLTAIWTCVGAGGGTCTASGSGNINDTVNLPVGASVTYTVSATISAAATGSLSNTATVATPAGITDSTPGNNTATDTDTLTPQADLVITKTDGVTTATPGGSVTYTITASNSGPSNVTGATVADTFPASLTATWTCVGAGGGTCTAAGAGNINDTVNLPSGGSVTYTASASISAAATGTLSNTASVTAPAGVTDGTPGNNSATDSDTLAGQADLSITKTDGVTAVNPGGSTTYTITASNAGPSNATGATVADTFPASLTATWTCAGAGGGTCTASGSGNINTSVNLPAGGSVTFTATASISGAASGSISNTASVTAPAGVTDGTPGNNSSTDTDTVNAAAVGPVTVTATAGTVGPTDYPTVKAAFDAINAGTHQGDVTVAIVASTDEGATAATLNSSGAGAALYTSVNIHPTNDGLTVTGAPGQGFGTIQLNGVDNVTLDGDNPNSAGINRNLTVTNTTTTTLIAASAVRVATSATAPFDSNSNITIKDLILNGNVTNGNAAAITSATGSSNSSFGIIVGPNGGASVTAITSVTGAVPAGANVNNLVIDNNSINRAARGIAFIGTNAASSTGIAITNNTVGAAATLTGNAPFATPATTVYTKGIYVQGTTAYNISGNTVQNILSFVATTINGIEIASGIGAGTQSIANNTINGVAQNAAVTNIPKGILLSNAGAPYTISGNTVNNVQGVLTGIAAASVVVGIEASTTATSGTISGNKVSKIYNDNPGSTAARGINIGAGNNVLVANNFVSDVNANGTGGFTFDSGFGTFGIRVAAGTGHKIYSNTVHMSGAVLGSPSSNLLDGAFCITATTLTGMDVRSNIFSNILTGGTTSAHVSMFLPTNTTSAMNLTLNNNDYNSGPAAATQGIAQAGTTQGTGFYLASNFNAGTTTPATNLRALTTLLGPATNDDSSKVVDPLLFSNSDLHITGVSPMIDMGVNPGALVFDIDGQARVNGAAADIGADEFFPAPGALQLSSSTYSGNEGSTVAITVSRSGGSAGTVGATLTLSDGTATGGAACTAGVDFINPGPQLVSFGDNVTTQVVNVSLCSDGALVEPAETFTATLSAATGGATLGSPLSATITIVDIPPAFNGPYTVGSGGNYPSLTNPGGIFEAINLAGATGNVVINITSDLTGETGSVPLNEVAGGFSVTIKPSGAARSITSTASAATVIKLNDADHVTIDGSLSGGTDRSLSIISTNTSANAADIWLGSSVNGAQSNVIKNLNLEGGANQSTANVFNFAIISSTSSSILTGGTDSDNNTYSNNFIKKVSIGIISIGGLATNKTEGTVISNNLIGPAAFGVDEVSTLGMLVFNENAPQITGNELRFIGDGALTGGSSGRDHVGISLCTGSASWSGTTAPTVVGTVTNANISGNVIHDIVERATFSAVGIVENCTNGGLATNNTIANNFIYNILANGTTPDQAVGIGLANSNGDTVAFNSVYMTGDIDPAGATTSTVSDFGISAALTTNTNLNLKDNISVMDINSNTAALPHAAVNIATGFAWGTGGSNFNNWYAPAANPQSRVGAVGGSGGTFQTTLAGWQTATTQDANSLSVDPLFVSLVTPDLHVQAGSPMIGAGVTIVGITTDIDGQARNSPPAIGADEVGVSADLSITKTDGVTTAVPGGSVTYSITVSNNGPSGVTGATVADTLPASLTATWTCVGTLGGTCTASGSGNINDLVNLPNGASVVYTVSASISGSATGTLSNTATVTAPAGVTDGIPGNNTSTDTDTLDVQADLAITKTDGVTSVTAGGSTTYTITASNAGPSNVTGATVADTFPASLTATWTCVGAGGGTCTAAGAGNINDTVNLPSGGSVTYTASATISGAASGSISNTATVTAPAGVTDGTPGNNSATDTDTVTVVGVGPVTVTATAATTGPTDYPTLKAAFDAINAGTHQGAVTVSIVSSTVEPASAVLNASGSGASVYTSVLVHPTNSGVSVSGSFTTGAVVVLLDADNVTIDGSVSGGTATGVGGNASLRNLTIQNTSAAATAAGVVAIEQGTAGANNDTIRNLNVFGQDPTQTLLGIHIGGNTIGASPTVVNTNNKVENCAVQKAILGIFNNGVSAAIPDTGSIITRNDLSATGANRLRRGGIFFFFQDGIQVTENLIGGIDSNEAADSVGIIAGLQAVSTTASASGGVTNAMIARNRITGVLSSSTTGFSAVGIAIAGGTTGPNTIVNNMVTGVSGPATTPDLVAGIFVAGVTGSTTRVYHNSVSLTGDRGTVASQIGSYGIAISGATIPAVELKNNIFSDAQTSGGGAAAKSYAIGVQTTVFTNLDSNFNDFQSTGANAGGFRRGGLGTSATDDPNLAAWQAATGKDANSFSVDPLFVAAATDLHLQTGSPMIDVAVGGLGVTDDIDGQTRPIGGGNDIGADEAAADVIAPDTMITSNPPNPSNSTSATFTFTGTDARPGKEAVVGFDCQLDAGAFATCTSPTTLLGLSEGSHTFNVRARDGAGNVDPTPATYTWVVDSIAPDTTITSNPPIISASPNATFTFTGSDPGGTGIASFECQLDAGAFAACTTPKTYLGLANGPHTFAVRAIDNAGNVDASPATFAWTINNVGPSGVLYGASNIFSFPIPPEGSPEGNPAVPQIYQIDRSNGDLSNFHTLTMAGFTVNGAMSLTARPTDGMLFIVLNTNNQPPTARRLATVDPNTGICTDIGVLTNQTISSIAFRLSNGVLYGASVQGGTNPETVFTIDTSTAALTVQFAMTNGTLGDIIAFHPNGQLYHSSGAGTAIFERFNVDTQVVTPLGSTANEAYAMGWSNSPQFMYLSDAASNLFTVNLNNGARTLVGAMADQLPSTGGLQARNRGLAFVQTPTAAGVQVSGRVMTSDGRGIRNARVGMSDESGNVRYAVTSTLGYYTFPDVAAGGTYIVGVESKRFHFASRVIQVFSSLTDVDLIAEQP